MDLEQKRAQRENNYSGSEDITSIYDQPPCRIVYLFPRIVQSYVLTQPQQVSEKPNQTFIDIDIFLKDLACISIYDEYNDCQDIFQTVKILFSPYGVSALHTLCNTLKSCKQTSPHEEVLSVCVYHYLHPSTSQSIQFLHYISNKYINILKHPVWKKIIEEVVLQSITALSQSKCNSRALIKIAQYVLVLIKKGYIDRDARLLWHLISHITHAISSYDGINYNLLTHLRSQLMEIVMKEYKLKFVQELMQSIISNTVTDPEVKSHLSIQLTACATIDECMFILDFMALLRCITFAELYWCKEVIKNILCDLYSCNLPQFRYKKYDTAGAQEIVQQLIQSHQVNFGYIQREKIPYSSLQKIHRCISKKTVLESIFTRSAINSQYMLYSVFPYVRYNHVAKTEFIHLLDWIQGEYMFKKRPVSLFDKISIFGGASSHIIKKHTFQSDTDALQSCHWDSISLESLHIQLTQVLSSCLKQDTNTVNSRFEILSHLDACIDLLKNTLKIQPQFSFDGYIFEHIFDEIMIGNNNFWLHTTLETLQRLRSDVYYQTVSKERITETIFKEVLSLPI